MRTLRARVYAVATVSLILFSGCGADRLFHRGPAAATGTQSGSGAQTQGGGGGESGETSTEPSQSYFESVVLPVLRLDVFDTGGIGCAGCHSNDKIPDFETALLFIVFKDVEKSSLYQRAATGKHYGVRWPADSAELRSLEAWILGTNHL